MSNTRRYARAPLLSLLPVLPLLTAVAVAGAQEFRGSVAVSGGSATTVVGGVSRAATIAPRLTYAPDPRIQLALDAAATRYDNRQWSAAGGVSGALRAPLTNAIAVTLDASSAAVKTSYNISYNTLAALPGLEASVGAITAFAGLRIARAASSAPGAPASPAPPSSLPFGRQPIPGAAAVTAVRVGQAVLFGANARMRSGDAQLVAGVREEHGRTDAVPTVDRSASLSVASGAVTAMGAFGMRTEPGTRAGFASGGVSLAVNSALSVDAGVGTYPSDRLIGTPAGRYLNLGVALQTSLGSGAPRAGRGVPVTLHGVTRLTLRAATAQSVDVAGDFSEWRPIAARRGSNGEWVAELKIPPGQYRYAFRVNGSTWTVPEGADEVDDGFGGKSAWLVVSPPAGAGR